MSETENKKDPKQPIRWLNVVSIAIIIFIILVVWFELTTKSMVRSGPAKDFCGNNLRAIGMAMLVYASDNTDDLPSPDKWCDLLLDGGYITKDKLICPCQKKKGLCSYAMNSEATFEDDNLVLLFDTEPGPYNRYGGPELVTFANHDGKGCNILYADMHVVFETSRDDLLWKRSDPNE